MAGFGPLGFATRESIAAANADSVLCQNRRMVGSKHIQRGTNRVLTYQAFFTETGPRLFIAAIVHEGDRLLATPNLEALYMSAHGSVEDVVIAALVRYLNDTTFGEGTPLEKRHDWTDFGPWK